jgi:hypothetical protein
MLENVSPRLKSCQRNSPYNCAAQHQARAVLNSLLTRAHDPRDGIRVGIPTYHRHLTC